jgi:hypothetical protein
VALPLPVAVLPPDGIAADQDFHLFNEGTHPSRSNGYRVNKAAYARHGRSRTCAALPPRAAVVLNSRRRADA